MAGPCSIGIIGLGIMGRRLLGIARQHPAFRPGFLWDPAETARAQSQALAPEAAIAASAAAVIAAADLVYLACPPVPRKDYALQAAEAGKPVFLEKPLGIDIAASQDLIERLAASGVPAAVNFTQAASPALAEIQRALAAGELGEPAGIDILVAYGAWPRSWQAEADWLRFRDEGGFTREVISHFLFLSARLLGPLRPVWARPSFPAPELAESHLLARLEGPGGVPVSVLGSVGGLQPDRQEVTVKGSRRSYRITDFYSLEVSDGGAYRPARVPQGDPREEALNAQLSELAKCVAGQPHALATPAEAFAVQTWIEALLAGVT
ncbi:Gfo/Idh/MocA family protein [Algihabitans albus]|uniref:Gfo/Idh/MocA family protein n=1 Tax=Algihabitans albus TaxID=2164067 RepID=UPI000E5D06FC|nr:Gfo/Idh/MocA family oxidoreductase [Algihabitans albus]